MLNTHEYDIPKKYVDRTKPCCTNTCTFYVAEKNIKEHSYITKPYSRDFDDVINLHYVVEYSLSSCRYVLAICYMHARAHAHARTHTHAHTRNTSGYSNKKHTQ